MTVHLKIRCGVASPCFGGLSWRDCFLRTILQVVLVWSLFFCLADSTRAADAPASESRGEFSTYRLAKIPPDAKRGLGSWIWTDKTFDHQTCRLWKDFDIPKDAKVVEARMRITVDDGYQMCLDGRELAQGANWRSITEYDFDAADDARTPCAGDQCLQRLLCRRLAPGFSRRAGRRTGRGFQVRRKLESGS